MNIFFPEQFTGQNTIFNYALIETLKGRVSWILDEEGNEERQKKANENLLKLVNPQFWNLNKSDNAEKEIELSYENLLISVSENSREDLKNITTFKFYNLMNYLKNKSLKNA